jgi:hypothetical protein
MFKYNYGETEIGQARAAHVVNQNARSFQIPVDHAVRMKIVKAVGHAQHENEPIGIRMSVDVLGEFAACHRNREDLEWIGACTDEGHYILVLQAFP